jgi:hypothetical protein
MTKHNYAVLVDNILFNGQYIIEEDEDHPPIFTVVSITLDNALDLMLVIDPRVVQEIENTLLEDHLWNS